MLSPLEVSLRVEKGIGQNPRAFRVMKKIRVISVSTTVTPIPSSAFNVMGEYNVCHYGWRHR